LIEAKEEAERMNELKSAFLANMSHEIRTPLTSILGFADMIEEEAQHLTGADASLSRFARLIGESGRRLQNTLETVLNLSKLEAGEADLSVGRVDLSSEVDDLLQHFDPKAESARLTLHSSGPEHPVWAWVDQKAVRIVLRNLISNAIKFTEAGGSVFVRVRAETDRPSVEVADTGIGMDPDQVPTLFDAFEQASTGMDRSHEGSGLGLTLARDLVEQMDGDLTVDTAKGEGTRMTVVFPPAPDSEGNTRAVPERQGRAEPWEEESPGTRRAHPTAAPLKGDR
jgi:signal transduction histidine kinase